MFLAKELDALLVFSIHSLFDALQLFFFQENYPTNCFIIILSPLTSGASFFQGRRNRTEIGQ
jgi:hypothetical protein